MREWGASLEVRLCDPDSVAAIDRVNSALSVGGINDANYLNCDMTNNN
jgi:hypothetical protein